MFNMVKPTTMRELQSRIDQRWKTEERIFHYNGLLKIFDRDRKKEIQEAHKLRRRQVKQIRELRKDCQYHRNLLGNSIYGNKQRLRNAIQNRAILLAYQNCLPGKVLEYFEHANTKRRRELDRLKFKKTVRMDDYVGLKFEKAELQDRLDAGFDREALSSAQQGVTNKIQAFVVRQNASAAIYRLYKNMLDLLNKDSFYFDSILKVLHGDCEEQCRCVLRAAELGQRAHEELSDIRYMFRWLESVVKVNLKDRDREVKLIRKCAEELYQRCKLLTRVESFGYMYAGDLSDSSTFLAPRDEAGTANQIQETKDLEETLGRVQDATLSSTFLDVFPRLLAQLHQEETLLKQTMKMKDFRKQILQMKHHSELILSSLTHHVAVSTTRFVEKEEALMKEIDEEKFRLQREKEAINDQGKMLIELKVVLQSMFDALNRVKEETRRVSEESESSESLSEKEETPSEIEKTMIEPVEQNTKVLLRNIEEKLGQLLAHTTETLPDEVVDISRIMHQHEMLQRHLKLEEIEYEMPLLEEQETEDSAVLTRSDIKLKSKQILDKNMNLMMMAQQGKRRSTRFNN